jgi:peptidoglycan hydrolase-like protein with peptidoglycan-binding domain
MQLDKTTFQRGAWAAVFTLLFTASLPAQTRITVPAGTVVLVRTDQDLLSDTAKVGQTFLTTVTEPVSVNGYTLIPANSRIRGVVSYVQPASGSRSGVMQVAFDRLSLPNGRSTLIQARLTSTDSAERAQIELRSDPRVVLVGERGGIGAAIAGAGSSRSAASGILAALGNMLSEGMDVNVPAGTVLAVQLERPITMTGVGAVDINNENTIFTLADRIRAAQKELARRGYYRGTATGVLDNATRRALFDFQLDNDIAGTGNLNGRTARALGILGGDEDTETGEAVLTLREAAVLRLAAQTLETRQRQDLAMATNGQLSARRTYTTGDLELLFALSAFADNALLYEQVRTTSNNREGETYAGTALVAAARRVDSALSQARPAQQMLDVWTSIRRQLAQVDPAYRP